MRASIGTAYRDLNPEQKMKAKVRAHANMFYNRDHPELREPCSDCGAEKAEMHHDDYRLPLAVRWLCRPCHLERHAHG